MPLSFNHWGTYEAEVVGGRLIGLTAAAGDPDPSPIGQSLLDATDHPVRVRRPAVRRGFFDEVASGERGPDRPRARGREPFVEVPWDEALDLVAGEIRRVRHEHGNEAIFAGSYGWASAGRFHNPQAQLFRLGGLLGGFVRSVNSYSYAAAEVVLPHVATSFFVTLGNQTSFEELAAHGRLMVCLGGLPPKNQQVENGGTYRHLAPSGFRALRDAGLRFVSISPLGFDVDSRHGAQWLAIRPGTDTAFLLGVAHTLVTEGLADQAFLSRYCSGVEPFLDSLTGRDAQWAEAICGIPAERIRALARDMAAGPTMLNAAWSLQRAEHGEHVYWAVIAVAALLGQIGTPGGGFGFGYGSVNRIGSSESPFVLPRFPAGRNPVKTFIPVARITELLEACGRGGTLAYDGQELDLPDTRLLYWCGGNPFHHHQDLRRLAAAWQRPECVVVHEQAWTATARFADVVLPATMAFERDDFGSAPLTGSIVAAPALVAPLAEARDDFAIFSGLAERFGLAEAFTEGLTVNGWLRRLWEETRSRAAGGGFDLPTFDAFWAAGVVDLPRPAGRRVLLSAFRADPQGRALPTPSGRIELWSPVLDALEVEGCPAVPSWVPPVEWLGSPLAARFPLHLLSNQPSTRLHSQLDYGRVSQAAKIAGREPILLSPVDAAARGIDDGDLVRVFNERGACLAGARVTDQVMASVVVMATGAWFDPDWSLDGLCRSGNPNVLTSARPSSALSQGPAAQSCLVEVERWRGTTPPAVGCYSAPELVGRPARPTISSH